METDFEGWNASVEANLAILYTPSKVVPDVFSRALSPAHELAMLRTLDSLRAISIAVKRDCFLLQRDITRWAVERTAADPVEARWAELSEAERRALLLKALRNTCGITSDMPTRRSFVPEINIPKLVRGRAFMELLARTCLDEMLPVDQEEGEFVPVRNEVWTKMIERFRYARILPWEGGKLGADGGLLRRANSRELRLHIISDLDASRNTFLFLFFWSTLLALDGQTQEYIPTRHTNGSDGIDPHAGLEFLAESPMKADEVRKTVDAWIEERKAAGHVCAKCDTPGVKLAEGKKMQKCGACLPAIALWYCDR